jgi:hypothetical protein
MVKMDHSFCYQFFQLEICLGGPCTGRAKPALLAPQEPNAR